LRDAPASLIDGGTSAATHLVSAIHKDGQGNLITQVTEKYDVFGNRVEEDVYTQATGQTVVSRFAFDGNNVWADLDGTNQLLMRRLYLDGDNQAFARITAAGVATWYLADHLGSIRDLQDNLSGLLVDHVDYDAYGNVTNETQPGNGDRFRFDGGPFVVAVGMYIFQARWYDPVSGRWYSQDPLGLEAGDTNLYRYVGNAPTEETDPSGLQAPGYEAAHRSEAKPKPKLKRKTDVFSKLTEYERWFILELPRLPNGGYYYIRPDGAISAFYGIGQVTKNGTEVRPPGTCTFKYPGTFAKAAAITLSLDLGRMATLRGRLARLKAPPKTPFNKVPPEQPPFDPSGTRGAAKAWTIKGRLKNAQLPTSGKVRYVPPKGYSPGQPLPRGRQNGYIDRFGNEWTRGPSRTAGQPFEWDVQLSKNATKGVKWASPDGKHLNVSLDGEVTH
jgi:RHS repeat-associated protein